MAGGPHARLPLGGEDVDLVREACERIAEVPTSSLEGLEPAQMATEFVDEQLQASLAGGLRLPSSLHGLPAWLPGRVEEVLAIASRTAELLQGAHLNHHDLRPDNLLVGHPAGEATVRAYVLDWNWVSLGPAWCDWVGLLPTMHSQGHDLTRLLDSTPLSRQAPPEAIDTWLAIVAVYMLENLDKPPPGSMSALRDHQRFFAAIFLASLAEHRGWRCPALKG